MGAWGVKPLVAPGGAHQAIRPHHSGASNQGHDQR